MATCHVRLTGIAVRNVTVALHATRLGIVFSPHNQDGRTPRKQSPFDQKSSKIILGQRLREADVQVDSHLSKKQCEQELGCHWIVKKPYQTIPPGLPVRTCENLREKHETQGVLGEAALCK